MEKFLEKIEKEQPVSPKNQAVSFFLPFSFFHQDLKSRWNAEVLIGQI
jgi:hypothetical protein